jgi:hypothetical protein
MRPCKRRWIVADQLETRSLLSTVIPGPTSGPNPVIQADYAKIKQDVQSLQSDQKMLAPTLQSDEQAIRTALANSQAGQAAKAQLQADETTWWTTLQGDWKAVTAATDPSTRGAALQQLRSDFSSALKVFHTDVQAISTAINNDPTVLAAKAKYQSDAAPLAADQSKLQADYAQLAKDLNSQGSPTPTPIPA